MNDREHNREELTLSVMTDRELDGDSADADDDDAVADADAPEQGGDDGADEDGGPTDPDSGEPDRRTLRARLVIGAIAFLLIGSVATTGFLGWQLWQDRQVTRAGEQAQAAAVQYAQILTSIDSAKVDENFNQVLDGATGEFKDMYSKSSVELRQLLIDNKASAHGVVVDSAIQTESKDTVVVLLFVDQSVMNAAAPDPRIDRSRIKMTMDHVDGRWRASKVELP